MASLFGVADPGVDTAQVFGELSGQIAASRLHGARWHDRCHDLRGLARGDLFGYLAPLPPTATATAVVVVSAAA
jgi:hypothetical protein